MDNIKLLITDCDGVLTDGGMYYFSDGVEAKKFNTRDGMGFLILKNKGIKIGIITGETNDIVKNRASKLNMDFLYMGVKDKSKIIKEICDKFSVNINEIIYIGDDLNDLSAMKSVGYTCCPSDACLEIKKVSNYICTKKGGEGVIREVVDHFFMN